MPMNVNRGHHILLITPTYPPMLGGGARYAHALAQALVAHDQRVTVLTTDVTEEPHLWQQRPRSATKETMEEGIRVIRCRATGLRGGRRVLLAWRAAMVRVSALPGDQAGLLMRMARWVPNMPDIESALDRIAPTPDLVHAFNLSWEWPAVAGWRWARARGIPFYVTPFTHLGVGTHDRVARNNTMDHQRLMMRTAAVTFALTDVERRGLIRYGIPGNRIHVVGGGVEPPPAATISPADVLRRFDLTPPLALFIGRLDREKGALDAMRAAVALHRRGCPITLGLVGQPSPEIHTRLGRLDADERTVVRPLGIVDEITKHALIEASAMLLLPSWVDSFGIVFLEAWQHRVPVIGARSGGIPGLVKEGRDGLLVEYGDISALTESMERLLTDRALAAALGHAGHAKVNARYTWEAVCRRTLSVYDATTGKWTA